MFHELTLAGIHSVIKDIQEKGDPGWVAVIGGIGDGKTRVIVDRIFAALRPEVDNWLDMIELLVDEEFELPKGVTVIENFHALNIMISTPTAPFECRRIATNIYKKLKQAKGSKEVTLFVESENRAGICLTRELFNHVITIPKNTADSFRKIAEEIAKEYDLTVENEDLYRTLLERTPTFASLREFRSIMKSLAEANRGKSVEKLLRLFHAAASQ